MVNTTADIYVRNNVAGDFLLGRPWQKENRVGIVEWSDGTYVTFNPDQPDTQYELMVVPDENFKAEKEIATFVEEEGFEYTPSYMTVVRNEESNSKGKNAPQSNEEKNNDVTEWESSLRYWEDNQVAAKLDKAKFESETADDNSNDRNDEWNSDDEDNEQEVRGETAEAQVPVTENSDSRDLEEIAEEES